VLKARLSCANELTVQEYHEEQLAECYPTNDMLAGEGIMDLHKPASKRHFILETRIKKACGATKTR
jgi:hypothetical protein